MSYFSSASMVSYQNAIPVFVDIKEDDFNINPLERQAITRKTKAIIFIDYGGNPSDIDKILAIGKKHNLHVLQDGAQSLEEFTRVKKQELMQKFLQGFHMAKY